MIHYPTPGREGYSLVEILVVMMIVGLMTGAAFLTLRPDGDPVRTAADQLHLDLAQAETLAVTSGDFIGLSVQSDRYDFLVYRQGEWIPLAGRRGLSGRTLEGGLRIRFAGQPVLTPADTSFPHYWFDPTGANEHALFEVRGDESVWHVEVGSREGIRLIGDGA